MNRDARWIRLRTLMRLWIMVSKRMVSMGRMLMGGRVDENE